ncbi:MAG TPA: histidinol phosphate phosphatase [Gammaproteobacteria bacterium]|nr:histidinol phosphate phosphatase [Gammaproteobacteria bacterium]
MPLTIEPALADFAQALADEARAITQKYFRAAQDIHRKPDGTPVTAADLEIEQKARSMIAGQYPGHGVFGEEEGEESTGSDWLWVIDPIDGTKSFATGKPTFGCLIALLFERKPVLGIIDMPSLDERWIGIKDQPTLYNGQACRSARTNSLKDATLNATTPDMFSPDAWEVFCRVSETVRFRQFGADCYAYGLLACGFTDLVMEAGLGRFDYLALVPVVEGAGGCISDWQGNALTFDSAGEALASANQELHARALEVIDSAQ